MEGHTFVTPATTNWAIIFFDAITAVLCLFISNAIVAPDAATGSCTSLYLITIIAGSIVSSMWIKPLVNLPGTRFYRIMERTFHKVILTGLLVTACLFFNKDAVILRALTGTFLLAFFVTLLLTRMAEHAYFKRTLSMGTCKPESMKIPQGLYHMGNRMVKRSLDILLSIIFLLTIYPVVYIVVFGYSKIRLRGAVCSTLRLCSLDGKEFTCVRFRALSDTNMINSLPLFFCVLVGSMSIVGTRPRLSAGIKPGEGPAANKENADIGKPGLTGWATLEGFQSEEEEMALNSWYLKNWSFGLDVFIILKGLCVSLFKKNK